MDNKEKGYGHRVSDNELAWMHEIERRYADYKAGKTTSRDAYAALREMKSRLN